MAFSRVFGSRLAESSRVSLLRPSFTFVRNMSVKVGDDLSALDVSLHKARAFEVAKAEGFKKTSLKELFEGKKVALFGLPGAFTTTCQKSHVPGWIEHAKDIKAKGVDNIVCVSMNDPFVLDAWGKHFAGLESAPIEMYSDADGDLTKALGLEVDLSAAGLGKRSTRYSMLVENGKLSKFNVEESPGDVKVSTGEYMLNNM